eukprot:CAMPEP_0176441846 /NCGR_PEP_ID=MMETSP0127-20121128/21456_1 /TAXON_ID=938130 /ORGANISM="Platyophrya macrostoma, Strain WH" /LENGTH=1140 /DNA_ID=CAMNT_0017826733 /DNA_START=36 /DNA_END=3458 /DNA_ORIENTATION=-
MLTLFKLANRNLSQSATRAVALRVENCNLSDLAAKPFATTRVRTLEKKKQIEEALEKFEKEDFGIDWDKLSSYDKETSKEFLEECGEKLEEFAMKSDQKAELENEKLKQRLGSNYNKFRGRLYQERHPGFSDDFAPLPKKLNVYDKANHVPIPKSQDYPESLNEFSKNLTELSYVDHLNGKFQKDWDAKYQDLTHYNELMPEMKNEDYLKGKPNNFLVIQNIPKTASRLSLLKLVKQFGEIKDFNIRENLAGENAFVEVLYANAADASKAKKELHRKKFQGSALYPMSAEDASREHPNRRTLVVYNLDQSWNEQRTIYELSKFGNVMDIQLPVEFKHGKLPTRSELVKTIDSLNLEPEQRLRVRIKEYVYQQKEFGLIVYEEKVHKLEDINVFNKQLNAREDNPDTYDSTTVAQAHERIRTQIKSDFVKFHHEEIAGAFPIYYCCADYSNIQHLLEPPSQEKKFTSEQELLRLSFTEREILRFQQSLFGVEQRNRGYCFVTFASEDDAKRALVNFTYRPLLNQNLAGTLKLDTNHVDWDAQKFNELMDTHDIKERVKKEKLKSEAKKLKSLKESAAIKEEFHKNVLDNKVEDAYLDTQVPKTDLNELELAPSEMRAKYTRKQQQLQRSYRDNQLYQVLKDELTTDSEQAKVNFDEEEAAESKLEVGRNQSTKITQNDYLRLLQKLSDRASISKTELSDITKSYFDEMDKQRDSRVLEDLAQVNLAMSQFERPPEGIQLADIERKLEALKETRVKDPQYEKFIHDMVYEMPRKGIEKEMEYEEYLKKKAALQAKNKKRKRTLFGSGAKKFSTAKELEYGVSVRDQSKEEVTKRTLRRLEEIAGKIHTGKLTEADFEELYRPRLENLRNNVSQDPHFLVRDQGGLQFVTEEDLKRFEEDETPENPEEQASFKEKMKQLKLAKIRRDKEREEKMKSGIPESAYLPVTIALLKKGIPLESFEFTPSKEYATIDEYIKQLNDLDEMYTYVKEKDEQGKEIILKLFKKKYKYNLERIMNLDSDTVSSQLRSILDANGISIPQSESGDPVFEALQRIAAEQNPTPKERAAIETVQEQLPEIYDMVVTGNTFADQDRFISEIIEQVSFLKLEDSTRALNKEDLVKYRSDLLNVKDENGKIYKSKYSKI